MSTYMSTHRYYVYHYGRWQMCRHEPGACKAKGADCIEPTTDEGGVTEMASGCNDPSFMKEKAHVMKAIAIFTSKRGNEVDEADIKCIDNRLQVGSSSAMI